MNLASAIDAHRADGPALVSQGETTTYGELRSQVAAIRDALDREFEHSLTAAGVSLPAFDLPRPARTARAAEAGRLGQARVRARSNRSAF